MISLIMLSEYQILHNLQVFKSCVESFSSQTVLLNILCIHDILCHVNDTAHVLVSYYF